MLKLRHDPPVASYSGIEPGARFVDDQRVRVVRLSPDCDQDLRWVLGEEGSVRCRFEDDSWGIWIPSDDDGRLWGFADDEIEPLETSEATLTRLGPRVDPRPLDTAEDVVAVVSGSRGKWDSAWRVQQEASAKQLRDAFRLATDENARYRLAYVIGKRRLRSAVPALLESLDGAPHDLRFAVLDALGGIAAGTKGALADGLGPPLVHLLKRESNPVTRSEIILTLGSAEYLAAAPIIEPYVESENKHLVYAARYALQCFSDATARRSESPW